MRRGYGRLTAALVALLVCAACASEDERLSAREAECRAKGYPPATAALYECVHPEQAATLERATEAWDQLEEGEGVESAE